MGRLKAIIGKIAFLKCLSGRGFKTLLCSILSNKHGTVKNLLEVDERIYTQKVIFLKTCRKGKPYYFSGKCNKIIQHIFGSQLDTSHFPRKRGLMQVKRLHTPSNNLWDLLRCALCRHTMFSLTINAKVELCPCENSVCKSTHESRYRNIRVG